jgi:hypothetical protein
VFPGRLPSFDDDLLPGRPAHCILGGEMRLRAAVLAAILSLWATPVFSQGCAMCKGSVAALPKDGQKAIGKGVFVLLFPPLGFMTLGVGLALQYGKKRDLEEIREDSHRQ